MAIIRAVDGTRPFAYNIKNPDGQSVFSGNTNSDVVEFDDSFVTNYPYVDYEVTSADNKIVKRRLDRTSAIHLRRHLKGYSVADGNFENHLAKIAEGKELGLNLCSTIIHQNDLIDDAALILYEQGGRFDHTKPIVGTPVKGYDRVVRAAYETSPGNTIEALENRVCLKVGLHTAREDNALNNGTTRKLFYGEESLMRRANGRLTAESRGSVVPSLMIPSFAAPLYQSWLLRYTIAFINRYIYAILDGTILSIGWVSTNNAEQEYPFHCRNSDGDESQSSTGDFSEAALNQFYIDYPAFAGYSAGQIDTAAQNGNSALARAWEWSQSDIIRKLEFKLIDAVHNQIPDFTRQKWVHKDCGSIADALSYRRKTINVLNGLSDRHIMLKTNDLTNYDDATLNYLFAETIAGARKRGAMVLIEPTANGGLVVGDSPLAIANRADVVRSINLFKNYCGLSYVYQTKNEVKYFTDTTGVANMKRYSRWNEFKQVGVDKKLVQASALLSTLYNSGGTDPLRTAYYAKRNAEQMTHIDTRIIDDVQPAVVVTTTNIVIPTTTQAPQVTTTQAPSGNVQPRIQSTSYPDHINLSFAQSGNGYLVNDMAEPFVEGGYQLWYIINDYVIKTNQRLQNFFWPSYQPLGIIKCKIRNDIDTVNKWYCPTDGYYDCDAGRVFSYNNSFAFTNVVFNIIS